MAINGINPNVQQTPQFLEATKQYGKSIGGERPYYQGYKEGVPNTTPQVAFIPKQEQMEAALAYLESGKVNETNIFTQKQPTVSTPKDVRGAAWDGFNVPPTNDSRELIANISGREDEIEDCPWNPYFA